MAKLYNFYEQIVGFEKDKSIKDDFEHFEKAIKRKAHASGFTQKKTGIRWSHSKFPVEEKNFAELIADLPPLKKLEEIVAILKSKEKTPDDLIEVIGSKETKGNDNFYAHFFALARMRIIWEHNGKTDIPLRISKPIDLVNQMLETVFLDDTKAWNEKNAIFNKLKSKLYADYNPSQLHKCLAWLTGLLMGLKYAANETHETSPLEIIPNFFYCAFNVAEYYVANFVKSCEQLENVTNLCSERLKALQPSYGAGKSSMSFFDNSRDKEQPAQGSRQDEHLDDSQQPEQSRGLV